MTVFHMRTGVRYEVVVTVEADDENEARDKAELAAQVAIPKDADEIDVQAAYAVEG